MRRHAWCGALLLATFATLQPGAAAEAATPPTTHTLTVDARVAATPVTGAPRAPVLAEAHGRMTAPAPDRDASDFPLARPWLLVLTGAVLVAMMASRRL